MKWFSKACCSNATGENNHKKLTIGLVGNPNCGKTTLFNALTNGCQCVGNWPGVTVERKSGFFTEQQQMIEVVDLPGTYSLNVVSDSAVDERIACEYILNRHVDVIVNILDASNLERHLYLTLQLLDMRVPMIVAVNMMDIADQRQIKIDLKKLEKKLGCSVIPLAANKNQGIVELKQAIYTHPMLSSPLTTQTILTEKNSLTQAAIAELTTKTESDFLAMRLLEGDLFAQEKITPDIKAQVLNWQARIQSETGEDADIVLADARYNYIQTLIADCIVKNSVNTPTVTARIDKIVLNRVLGIPIFLAVMYLMFFFAINIGGAFQDFFDISGNTIFVGGVNYLLTQLSVPAWLTALIANGIGKGINTTITFIPVIGAMFLFLALLEDSGYMARAAFVVDRLMRVLGLPGKSFVPMVVGFGCNVPGVMAARTLENKRDRILTVMMSPFMSCGARLAIYAVFVAAFFPIGGQNIIFVLYLIGILMAMLTGFLLRKTLLKGESAPLIMELPPYHIPHFRTLSLHAWQRLKGFVLRAGKLIVPICILLGTLNSLNVEGTLNSGDGDVHSILSVLGLWITPIFSPMGIQMDNWPAAVSLLTGVLAKEVVVGTLNTLYSQLGHLSVIQADTYSFWGGLQSAFVSIPANLVQLGSSLSHPVLAKASVHNLSQSVYGLMYQHFDGQVGAMAYLLFVLLYFPCISTTAAMVREVSRVWTVFSVLWTTGVAYCVAVGFYQAATFVRHPFSSSLWLITLISVVGLAIFSIRAYAAYEERGVYEFA